MDSHQAQRQQYPSRKHCHGTVTGFRMAAVGTSGPKRLERSSHENRTLKPLTVEYGQRVFSAHARSSIINSSFAVLPRAWGYLCRTFADEYMLGLTLFHAA